MTPLKPLGHNNSRIMIPRMPSWVRYVMSGVIVSVFVYAFVMLNAVEQADSDPDIVLEKIIVVRELDADLLATTRDKSRSDRLHLDAEPLRHLLAEAIDVGPSVAAARGVSAKSSAASCPEWLFV